jgi:hypothetical protein
MGDLVRALSRAIALAPEPDSFFLQLSGDEADVRDRIAAHLDQALFESVIASEIRAFGTCGAFDRLFDLLPQRIHGGLGCTAILAKPRLPNKKCVA